MGLALVKNLVVSVEVVVGVGTAALVNDRAVVVDGTMAAEEEEEEEEEGFLGVVGAGLVWWFLVFFLILFLAGTGTGIRGAAGSGTEGSTSACVLFLNAATTSLLAFLLKNAANIGADGGRVEPPPVFFCLSLIRMSAAKHFILSPKS